MSKITGNTNKFISPLRYPGGKSRISNFLEDLILINNLEGCTLYELYAGGAGASLNVLFSGLVKKIILNDLDFHIYAFWDSILNETEEFIKKINKTKISVDVWKKQKEIYDNFEKYSKIEVGFSTFFLNRSNRSGILYRAGPIGGFDQSGNYKIDVRFNKLNLISRIENIAEKKDQIKIYNRKSIPFLKYIFNRKNKQLIFLDPPYYNQGENLYLNFYNDKNHSELAKLLKTNKNKNWILTYDNVERINDLYKPLRKTLLPMTYTLQDKKVSKEIMMFSDNVYLPKKLRLGSKSMNLNLSV